MSVRGKVKLYPLLGLKGHSGIDVRTAHGQPIYAATDGFVREIQTEPSRGLGIGIVSIQTYSFDNLGEHYAKTRYWHLKSINVSFGQRVRMGELIGYADNTGLSSGDHLHFELKAVEYLNNSQVTFNVYQSNGYVGSPKSRAVFQREIRRGLRRISLVLGIQLGVRQRRGRGSRAPDCLTNSWTFSEDSIAYDVLWECDQASRTRFPDPIRYCLAVRALAYTGIRPRWT